MRSIIFGSIAAAALATASLTPAEAQWRGHHGGGHWGGPGISLHFGAPAYGYYGGGGGPYAYGPGPYAYGPGYGRAYAAVPACEIVRVRHVRPNGRVVWRTIERC